MLLGVFYLARWIAVNSGNPNDWDWGPQGGSSGPGAPGRPGPYGGPNSKNKSKTFIGLALAGVGIACIGGAFFVGSNDNASAEDAATPTSSVAQSRTLTPSENPADTKEYSLVKKGVSSEDANKTKDIIAGFPSEIGQDLYNCSPHGEGTICGVQMNTDLRSYIALGSDGPGIAFSTDEGEVDEAKERILAAAEEAGLLEGDSPETTDEKSISSTDSGENEPSTAYWVSNGKDQSAYVDCTSEDGVCELTYVDNEAGRMIRSNWFKNVRSAAKFLDEYQLIKF